MKFSYWEAFITSFVVGFAESYFAPFSLHVGSTPLESGILLSLPLIFAGLAQFILQPYFHYLNVARFVQRATLLQSFSLLSLALISQVTLTNYFPILLLLFSIYWLGHFAVQPAWNRWISEILPVEQGQNYFSLRVRLNQIGIIAGLIFGGVTLHLNIIDIEVSKLFLFLFLFSFVCKILTYYFFTKHQSISVALQLSKEKMLESLKNYSAFFKSYARFNFTVYLSSTFVAVYLLSIRKLNYLDFMWIMIGLFLGKMLTTYLIEKKIINTEPTRLMFIGGFFAAPLPGLWPFFQDIWLMFALHLLSGMAWAAWEVGLSLCFLKNLPAESKMETISVYNYIGVTTQVVGTLSGALIVRYIFKSNYDYLFIFAGIVRWLGVLPLRKNTLSLKN